LAKSIEKMIEREAAAESATNARVIHERAQNQSTAAAAFLQALSAMACRCGHLSFAL
jgi:hypothetical protein